MLRLLRLCDSDEKPALGYVYEGMMLQPLVLMNGGDYMVELLRSCKTSQKNEEDDDGVALEELDMDSFT
ncbi:hypothetical protein L2E82_02855 [Cichorium intybus]|uniref:Uncharacterized protein n=1 Tax=Cichorium intybus TaxID=13427 RepID=A0ACB9H2H7_CICIN|nr:hypothetical protein L2E82_02855 [Cichorium intybus]